MRFGHIGVEQRDVDAEKLREGRVYFARRNECWSEIDGAALVRRAYWLVHFESDEMFVPYRGAPDVSERAPLYFSVSDDNEITFYERCREKWSDVVASRARRGATV